MPRDNIQHFTLVAARLLLSFLYSDGSETLYDLPRVRERAGLSVQQYQVAYAELASRGFLEYQDGSVAVYVGSEVIVHD